MAKIMVVLAKPGEPARPVEIENTYEAVRDAIGGIITTTWCGLGEGVCAYVHDEGLLIGLPWNRCHPPTKTYLAGPILVVSDDGSGEDRSLDDEQIKLVLYGLNYIMERMATTPSSIEELERLTGEPAVQIHFEQDDDATREGR